MRRPENFDFEPSDGETWTILGTEYRSNPRDLVEPWAFHVVQTWAICRGEMGLLQLPDPGGLNDQSAWLMDAFGLCGTIETKLRAEEKRLGADQG